MKYCLKCFKKYNDELNRCPFCGTAEEIAPKEPIQLEPGTILNGRYLIGLAIGSGGFGILYKAWDLKLETVVAVKEFFCSRLMTRAAGVPEIIVGKKQATNAEFEYRKSRFLDEARNLAKFTDSKFIPNVFEFFEENGTAYFAMEYLQSENLSEYLKHNGGKIDSEFAIYIANSVAQALIQLHGKGIVHRDVAPDNILIVDDNEVKCYLIDLGAAYLPDAKYDVIDIILKPGYSPPEQYDSMKGVGVWSDIYALGATLYIALTGVKPDESSNRKIEDTVLPPHELNPNISENLSNAIMKAMAIEPHMRFRTVKEFLQAINGERKVVTLSQEKKRRKRKRIGGILATCAMVALVGLGVWHSYDEKKAEQYLKDAKISVWYCAEEGSAKQSAVESVMEDFHATFPNVEIETKAIAEADYEAELEQAAENQDLPDLFESSLVSQEVLEQATDVSKILDSEQAKKCLFLEQYDKYYTEKKQIPLGIEVPMACVITKGVTAIDYGKTEFSSVKDFSTDKIAVGKEAKLLIQKNFGDSDYMEEDTFLNNESNSSAVLLTSTMQINKIRETLTNYSKKFVYYNGDQISCNFVYEWSIGKGSKNQTAAAEKLLSWMLGNAYQNTLMVSRCNEGQLPVNETCFKEKTAGKNYKGMDGLYQKFVFEK